MGKNRIQWKNIYYMLTYAIDELAYMKPDDSDIEKYKSLDDLLASLMCRSAELLYENNFLNDYNKIGRATDRPRGNILMQETYDTGAYAIGKIYCENFELNINSLANKVIKSAARCLMRQGKDLSIGSILGLRRLVDELNYVNSIEGTNLNIEDLEYVDLPDWYKPAVVVSKLILDELLGKDEDGISRLFRLNDNQRLKYIFEKFVRNFYRIEYRYKAKTTKPVYTLEGGRQHRLDILLESENKAVIIDTKWYEGIAGSNRSGNISQVYDYIGSYKENESLRGMGKKRRTTGIVLYAMTEDNKSKLNRIERRTMGKDLGSFHIYEKTINLNQEFDGIKKDLIKLVDKHI